MVLKILAKIKIKGFWVCCQDMIDGKFWGVIKGTLRVLSVFLIACIAILIGLGLLSLKMIPLTYSV